MPEMTFTSELQGWCRDRALTLGFDLAGIADVPLPDSVEATESQRRYMEWLEAGRAGEMEWLRRTDSEGVPVRSGLHRAVPWAKSVIVCAVSYNADPLLSIESSDPRTGWIARYAWSGQHQDSLVSAKATDYHNVLLPKLRELEAQLHARLPGKCETRCYVDTGPIVERDYAERAGIGWIGKNTCVLNQQKGSWLLLGVIITSIPLEVAVRAIPAADRCGSCTRCLDACPTDALIGARQMDASRCIAYLTIEKKGGVPDELRPLMGRQVFGCDICQDVCPWNRRAPVTPEAMLPPRREMINPALAWLAGMDGAAFNQWFRNSPLERTGRKRIHRNVAIAMGNSGESGFLPTLRTWTEGEDATLAEAASWAIARLTQVD